MIELRLQCRDLIRLRLQDVEEVADRDLETANTLLELHGFRRELVRAGANFLK